jgi:hypothetical protein
MIDWLAGKPVMTHDELVPPSTWKLFRQTGAPVTFLHPGDWTARAMWATGLTAAGAVDWQETLSPAAYLSGVRVVSPDEQATYEYVTGVLIGEALTLDEAASAAEQGVLGDRKVTEPICVYRDTSSFNQVWTRAGRLEDQVVVTGGNLYSETGGYSAYSTLGYQSFIGPEEQFTELMRKVFIPIVFQFMAGGIRTG